MSGEASGVATISFVEALLRVQGAQKALSEMEWADLTDPSNSYEQKHFALKDELVALWPIAADLGIDMRVIEAALGSGGLR